MRSRHIQLYKSCVSNYDSQSKDFKRKSINKKGIKYLPECVKGFVVGMNSPESVAKNLQVLTLPNQKDELLKGKYLSF